MLVLFSKMSFRLHLQQEVRLAEGKLPFDVEVSAEDKINALYLAFYLNRINLEEKDIFFPDRSYLTWREIVASNSFELLKEQFLPLYDQVELK